MIMSIDMAIATFMGMRTDMFMGMAIDVNKKVKMNTDMDTDMNLDMDVYTAEFAAWSAEMARAQKEYLADAMGGLPDISGALDPITGLEILPGYDPPPLNIANATAEMAQAAEDFLAKQASAIDNIVGGAANMMGIGDNSSGSWVFNWSMSDMTD